MIIAQVISVVFILFYFWIRKMWAYIYIYICYNLYALCFGRCWHCCQYSDAVDCCCCSLGGGGGTTSGHQSKTFVAMVSGKNTWPKLRNEWRTTRWPCSIHFETTRNCLCWTLITHCLVGVCVCVCVCVYTATGSVIWGSAACVNDLEWISF